MKTFYQQEIENIKENFLLKEHVYEQLAMAKEFMDIHFANPIDTEVLANKACFSKFHFIRIFKNSYGRTPNQYLTAIRIEKAKLLLHTNVTVREVCFAVGFDSVSSFTGLFKKITGISPSSYKKKIAQKKQFSRS